MFCVKFGGEPTKEDLAAAYKKAPYPWGSKEKPQAFPSSYVKGRTAGTTWDTRTVRLTLTDSDWRS